MFSPRPHLNDLLSLDFRRAGHQRDVEGQDVRGHAPRLDATRESVGAAEVSEWKSEKGNIDDSVQGVPAAHCLSTQL